MPSSSTEGIASERWWRRLFAPMACGALVFIACSTSLSLGLIPSYAAFWLGISLGGVAGVLLGLLLVPRAVAAAVSLFWSLLYTWLASLRLVRCEPCVPDLRCGPCVAWFSVIAASAAAGAVAFAIVSVVRRGRGDRNSERA